MVVEKQIIKSSGHGVGVYTTIVDDCDADLLEQGWSIKVDGQNSYVRGTKRKYTSLHKMVIERALGHEVPKGLVVDHINGDSLNNTRANLRVVTRRQNNANSRNSKLPKSGYRGVSWQKRARKYEASIRLHLGYFDTPEDAHEAYKKAHVERHGKFSPYYVDKPDNAQS